MLNHNSGRFLNRFFWMYCTISLNIYSKFFVICTLTYPGILDLVSYFFDRRINSIYRNYSNCCILWQIIIRRNIPSTLCYGKFNFQSYIWFKCAYIQIRVHYFKHICICFNITSQKLILSRNGHI